MSAQTFDYSPAMNALRRQRDAAMDAVRELEAQLDAARKALEPLAQALESLERVQGGRVDDAPVDRPSAVPRGGTTRKKVRSTAMVIDFARSYGAPISRRDILQHFREIGVAEHWENPENALNTAIGRAKEQGALKELANGWLVYDPEEHRRG